MRSVLDANVLVSAIISPRGSPAEILHLWDTGTFELVLSPPILEELARVIHYPRIQKRYNLPEEQVAEFLHLIARRAIWVEPQETLSVIAEDPSDNRYLECAVAAGAQYLVSDDNHLLALGTWQGVEILHPAGFVAVLNWARDNNPGVNTRPWRERAVLFPLPPGRG